MKEFFEVVGMGTCALAVIGAVVCAYAYWTVKPMTKENDDDA